jgi:hypothetical protein
VLGTGFAVLELARSGLGKLAMREGAENCLCQRVARGGERADARFRTGRKERTPFPRLTTSWC